MRPPIGTFVGMLKAALSSHPLLFPLLFVHPLRNGRHDPLENLRRQKSRCIRGPNAGADVRNIHFHNVKPLFRH